MIQANDPPVPTRPRGPAGAALSAVIAVTALAVVIAAQLSLILPASGQDAKKPVPAVGIDPGGVMVAIVGRGIDYTSPAISRRLARDGEGEIIGFDLVDRDRRPYCGASCSGLTAAAATLLADAPQSRLAIFRADGVALAAPALQMAVQAKADVVVVDLADDPQAVALLRAAAERFRDTLIIFAPRNIETGIEPPASGATSETPTAPNAPAQPPSSPVLPSVPIADTVFTATPCPNLANEPAVGDRRQPGCPNSPTANMPPALARAARVAAEAAIALAASPSTRGAALRNELEAPKK
jgi:hypothetical protein